MRRRSGPITTVARRVIAIAAITAMAAVPLAPATPAAAPPPTTLTADVRLAAATVPPGGLITSFLGNQVIYCSIICPLVVETAATAVVTTLQSPGTFLTALQSGDLWKALGVAAASVTGPTNAAAQATIVADGTLVAPRALNAFQVGVVGRLNVLAAVADGPPGILEALQTARRDTFTALNAPIVPNPTPTAVPRGVLQVVVVEAINVVAAIIFPAFNHVLSAVFETPDAIAQELAATGDPVRALGAGVDALTGRLAAAVTAVADSVVVARNNIRAAIEESRPVNAVTRMPDSATSDTTTADQPTTRDESIDDAAESTDDATTDGISTDGISTTRGNNAESRGAHGLRDGVGRPDSSGDGVDPQETVTDAEEATGASITQSSRAEADDETGGRSDRAQRKNRELRPRQGSNLRPTA